MFVFGSKDFGFYCNTSIEKYSSFSNSLKIIAHMPNERNNYCVCSFMGNAYVFGVYFKQETINSFLMFNTRGYSWKEVAEMNESRYNASSIVFEGKIVVSGGCNNRILNTVEAYDNVANTWTNMPNMNKRRYYHKSVAVKNKFFIVGGNKKSCEVYDLISKKFVLLKSPYDCFTNFNGYNASYPDAVISIGSKFYVFHARKSACLIYGVESSTWADEICELSRNPSYLKCVKVPQC